MAFINSQIKNKQFSSWRMAVKNPIYTLVILCVNYLIVKRDMLEECRYFVSSDKFITESKIVECELHPLLTVLHSVLLTPVFHLIRLF